MAKYYSIKHFVDRNKNDYVEEIVVNEENIKPIGNNTFESAQRLHKNPVILGGYVNRPYQGDDGNS